MLKDLQIEDCNKGAIGIKVNPIPIIVNRIEYVPDNFDIKSLWIPFEY